MTIIELSSGSTQFYSALVKPYYNPVIKTDKNLDKDIKNIFLETPNNFKYYKTLSTRFSLYILPILVPSTSLISLTPFSTLPLTFLILAKRRRKRL